MFFFSGTIEKDRVYPRFSLIKSSVPNIEITNVYDSFKQKMFVDKQKKLYEWELKDPPRLVIDNSASNIIKADYRPLNLFNEVIIQPI